MRITSKQVLFFLICLVYVVSPINVPAQSDDWQKSIASARQLHDEANFSAAIVEAKRALALAETSFGKNDTRVAETLELLALLNHLVEKAKFAVPLYVRAVNIRRALDGGKDKLAETLFKLAHTYYMLGKLKLAVPAYQEGIALSEPLEESDSEYLVDQLRDLARIYLDLKRYSEAERTYLRYLGIYEMMGVRNLYSKYEEVAEFYRRRRNYPKAEEYYSLALSAMKKSSPDNDPNIPLLMRRAAELYTEEKKYAQALVILDDALVILERESALSAVAFANVYADKARIYKRMKMRAKAMEYINKANSWLLKEKVVTIEPYSYSELEE